MQIEEEEVKEEEIKEENQKVQEKKIEIEEEWDVTENKRKK